MSIYHGDFRKEASIILKDMLQERLKKKNENCNEQLPKLHENSITEVENVTLRQKTNDNHRQDEDKNQFETVLMNKPEHSRDRRSFTNNSKNISPNESKFKNLSKISDTESKDPVCDKCKCKIAK